MFLEGVSSFSVLLESEVKLELKFSNVGKSSRQMFFFFFCGFLGNMTSFVCCLRESEREKSAAGEGMIVYIKSASPSVLIHHK